MNKGKVLSIDQKWAYVFTEDCQMIRLPLEPCMAVGKEIQIHMKRTETKVAAPIRRLKPALIAACLVLLVTVGVLFSQGLIFNPVYARVSIDVNPSLELSLNRQLTVISVKAMNQDAERLMAGEDFKGLGVEEAIYRWTARLKASNQYEVKTMLLSAVMPGDAETLRTRLMQLEETQNQGELKNIAVRFIYTNDATVGGQAQGNSLSIGRQMLLNQAQAQHQNFNAQTIAAAPLGDLIQNLLQNQDRNQTRLTQRTTQSMSEAGSGGATAASRETSRETSRLTSGSASGSGSGTAATNQNTNQYTNGSSSGTGSSSTYQYSHQYTSGNGQQGTESVATNQQTSQMTSQITSQVTSGSTQGSGTGSGNSNPFTSQNTSGSTFGSGTGKQGG